MISKHTTVMLRNTRAGFKRWSSFRTAEDIKKRTIEIKPDIITVNGEKVTKTRPKQSHGPQ
jgi:hypothetical protein